MSSCEKHTVPSYPVLTSSGDRDCVPEPERRRRCQACDSDRPFCHGRCVFNTACFFGTCSDSPYRTGSENCAHLAEEAEEDPNVCQWDCHYYGPETCQTCIEDNLPRQCGMLSGASCWHCSSSVSEKYPQCQTEHQNATEVIQCIKTKQVTEECDVCVCTWLCYRWPESPECMACLTDEQAAGLFINQDKCQQDWVFSQADKKCFKTFKTGLNWTEAALSCFDEDSILGEPKSFESYSIVMETFKLHGIKTEAWVGGKSNIECHNDDVLCNETFYWNNTNQKVDTGNWAPGFPDTSLSTSCMHQSAEDGFFRNNDCSLRMPYICEKNETQTSTTTVQNTTQSINTQEINITTQTATVATPPTQATSSPSLATIFPITTETTYSTVTEPLSTLATVTTAELESPVSECNCGITQKRTRIVGGIDAEVNEFPWQV